MSAAAQPLHEVTPQSALFESILELIRRTSTILPDDVVRAVTAARCNEVEGSNADVALNVIGCNIGLARDSSLPLCQDTGTILFYVHTPAGYDQLAFEEIATEAVRTATKKGYLRQNSVDSITGTNTGDDTNPDPVLAELEARVVEKANQSGIGPMGFGGKTTLLACKIGTLNRLPASFFVSIAYMCWAYRRRGAQLDASGNVTEWLY